MATALLQSGLLRQREKELGEIREAHAAENKPTSDTSTGRVAIRVIQKAVIEYMKSKEN